MAKDEGNAAEYDWSQFHGYEVPHYTQVPDVLFDEHLRHLSGAEVKLLLWIVRKTFGYGKRADDISLGQLANGTGLGISSVKRSVKDLEAKGLILVKRDLTKVGDSAVNTYALRMTAGGRPKMDLPSAQNGPHKKQPLKKQETTESDAHSGMAPSAEPVASGESDSDELQTACWSTATALQRPAEAKQLTTWARKNNIGPEVIAAAGRLALERGGNGDAELRKPVAYVQTVAKLMVADQQLAAEVGKRKQADQRRSALGYARGVYADKIIGGDWRQVLSIVTESYGAALATAVVDELRTDATS